MVGLVSMVNSAIVFLFKNVLNECFQLPNFKKDINYYFENQCTLHQVLAHSRQYRRMLEHFYFHTFIYKTNFIKLSYGWWSLKGLQYKIEKTKQNKTHTLSLSLSPISSWQVGGSKKCG
jgi:hypothetical protein